MRRGEHRRRGDERRGRGRGEHRREGHIGGWTGEERRGEGSIAKERGEEEREGKCRGGEGRGGRKERRKEEKRGITHFFGSPETNVHTLSHLSGQQNPSAEKTKLALNSRNFFRNSLGFASRITS